MTSTPLRSQPSPHRSIPGVEGSPFPYGAHLMFADGSVRFIKNSINPEVLKSLATPDGGEPIPEDAY